MPATVTLASTTLSAMVDRSNGTISLASTSGLIPGTRLFVDGELLAVTSLEVDGTKVRRGVDGTSASEHVSGATVIIGQAHQFYSQDPVGRPAAEIPVSPYINALNGSVWYARGDAQSGSANRWWQRQTSTRETGPLGVITTTQDPTIST